MLKVDYKSFPDIIRQIRVDAHDINLEIKEAFIAMNQCHSVWTGDRYNTMVEKFNGIVDDVNKILVLIVRDIPFTLETIYNNYEDHNTDTKKGVVTTPVSIIPLEVPGEEPLSILGNDESVVQPYINRVTNSFDTSTKKLEKIQNYINNLEWQGTARTELVTSLASLKNKITISFESISDSFKKLVEESVDAILRAESSNNVSGTTIRHKMENKVKSVIKNNTGKQSINDLSDIYNNF